MKNNGFTLIELMIVIAIVAILVAVAYPSYLDSVRKTKRAEGKALVLAAAQQQERHFTQFMRYGTALITSGTETAANVLVNATSENGSYTLTITNPQATSFTLRATPQGAQASDTDCGYLTLNNLGVEGKEGGGDCW